MGFHAVWPTMALPAFLAAKSGDDGAARTPPAAPSVGEGEAAAASRSCRRMLGCGEFVPAVRGPPALGVVAFMTLIRSLAPRPEGLARGDFLGSPASMSADARRGRSAYDMLSPMKLFENFKSFTKPISKVRNGKNCFIFARIQKKFTPRVV